MARPWMTRAKCLDESLEIAFLAEPDFVQVGTCGQCPVSGECLLYAAETRATSVVMGGLVIGLKPITVKAENAVA